MACVWSFGLTAVTDYLGYKNIFRAGFTSFVIAFALVADTHLPSASALAWSPEDVQETIRIPRKGTKKGLLVRICRPYGSKGDLPLAVINHGRPSGATRKERLRKIRKLEPYPCGYQTSPFTLEGYIVAIPVRRGYGATGGPDVEKSTSCRRANYIPLANAAADDIHSTIRYLKTLPGVAPDRTIVIGQSVGGLATIALASRNPIGIAAYINFAGGHGGHRNGRRNSNCSPSALVRATAHFGKTARVPMLWIYTENDSYFGPKLARRMYASFAKSGGIADFKMLPPFIKVRDADGHRLFTTVNGPPVWEPIVYQWLKERGLYK